MALSIRAKRATTAIRSTATAARPIVNRSNWAGRAQLKASHAKNSPVAMAHSNPIWANNARTETSSLATVALTAASKPVGCAKIQTHHAQKSFAKIKLNTANASKCSMATAKSTKISKIATTETRTITTDVRKASSIWAGFAQSLENLAAQRNVAMAYSPATKNATTATTTMATVARCVVGEKMAIHVLPQSKGRQIARKVTAAMASFNMAKNAILETIMERKRDAPPIAKSN